MKIVTVLSRKRGALECVKATAPLADAIALMDAKAIGSVGVIDAATAQLSGILSQHELTGAIAKHGERALRLPVAGFMRSPAPTCGCQDSANDVMRIMTRDRIRHAVALTETGAVGGIISLGDLVAAMLEEARLEAGVLRDMARSHMLATPA